MSDGTPKGKAPVVLSIAAVKSSKPANKAPAPAQAPPAAPQVAQITPKTVEAQAPNKPAATPADAIHDLVEATATRIQHRATLIS
ncbi:MAG: hypothetical protein VX228_10660, partial [Pseudomonadota bacterium]|nr:hypothetical protein [Pseudomonadota bacterium]